MQHRMFEPSSKDMKAEYPELGTVKEFVELRDKELKFVWYFANVTSPLCAPEFTDDKKIRDALKFSGLEKSLTPMEQTQYIRLEFPERINIAIKRMRTYNLTTRVRAAKMIDMMLDNLEKSIDVQGADIYKWTMEEKKSYSSLVKNVTDVLPELVQAREEGYGLKEVKGNQLKGPKLMDRAVMEGNQEE